MAKSTSDDFQDPFLGRVLIASPHIVDPRFKKTIIYVCGHDDTGSMGIIINQPHPDITLLELLEQSNSKMEKCSVNPNIFHGGPVETDRGFVLHTSDYKSDDNSTYRIADDIYITANAKILKDIASCKGPEKSIISLGYASWLPGQLESEVTSSDWFVIDVDQRFIFDIPPTKKWSESWKLIGINPSMISSDSGTG